jgi:Raf kinase inhibitor-like YbhB/YbcL family protein
VAASTRLLGVMVRRSPLALLAAAALAGGLVLAACSESDGRVLPEPDPAKTTTSVSAPIVPSTDAITGGPFTLLSPSIQDGGGVPVDLTCFGGGTSPDLSWTGTPEGATSLALVMTDPDAQGFVHWIVTGIDPSIVGFGLDGLPEGVTQGPNSAGGTGWTPPCPPKGSGTHHYVFQLYALPADYLPSPTTDPKALAKEIALSSVGSATLTGTVDAPASS